MSEDEMRRERGWVERLRSDGPDQAQAIAELRAYLLRGLAKSLSQRYGGRVDIDDVAQMALLKILASLDSFLGRSRFETWAMAIAIRVGISELRRNYYRTVSLGALSSSDGTAFDVRDARASAESNDQVDSGILSLLHQLIEDTLSERQRTAIRGTLAGLPVEIIAERLGSNRNAIYKLVHDARVRLKQGFEQHGVAHEEIFSHPSQGS